MNKELQDYIASDILPRYDNFDAAHKREHALMVIRQSMEIAKRLHDKNGDSEDEEQHVNPDMVYTIAAYHDTGLCEGREHHHEASARIIRADRKLRQWFSEEQIDTMAEAAEDHRASANHAPRSIYGRIVAEADRYIDPEDIIRRTIQFGLDHYPSLSPEEHYQRTRQHLHEKYGRHGYLRLWFDDSPNAERLEELRRIIDDEHEVHQRFQRLWHELNSPTPEE